MSKRNTVSQQTSEQVKPVGAWVVGGFLLATVLGAWLLVSLVFISRS